MSTLTLIMGLIDIRNGVISADCIVDMAPEIIERLRYLISVDSLQKREFGKDVFKIREVEK